MTELGSLLAKFQIISGVVIIVLAVGQVMLLRRKMIALRAIVYAAFVLLVGSVAFGKYYAQTAPGRLESIEAYQPSVAVSGYTEAIRLNPTDSELYYRRGRTDYYLNRYEDAVADFTNALQLSPNTPKYLLGRAFAFLFLHDLNSAERDLNLAISNGYQSSEANLLQGIIFDMHGRYNEAILQYSTALHGNEAARYRCSALFGRGYDYQREKRYDEALADYTSILESCNENKAEIGYARPAVLSNRGVVHWALSQKKAAFEDWDKALALDPTLIKTLIDRSDAYRELGDLKDALLDINRCIELSPNDPEVWMKRASIYSELNDPARANRDLHRAQQLFAIRSRPMHPMYTFQMQTPFGTIATGNP
jgi:tetratricopeptide (TPR) repeat protein